jgi:hypothetical protein
MSQVVRSSRPLGETIVTQYFTTDEYRVPLAPSDFDRFDAFAFVNNSPDPLWTLIDGDPDDVTFATPRPWPLDSTGYTFEHKLRYGEDGTFFPSGGSAVRIEYHLRRVPFDPQVPDDRPGPKIIRHYATLDNIEGSPLLRPLTLTACTPNTGDQAGGEAVVLAGTGFSIGIPSVTFDGDAATDVVVVSDTSITCTTPAHGSAEAVDVVVTRIAGVTATLTDGFTYA